MAQTTRRLPIDKKSTVYAAFQLSFEVTSHLHGMLVKAIESAHEESIILISANWEAEYGNGMLDRLYYRKANVVLIGQSPIFALASSSKISRSQY